MCGYNTIHGIKDIRHDGNTFIDVKVWDIQSGAISSNTHEHATGTIIIGGVMTNQLFTDQGKYTKIFDEWQGFKLGVDSLDIPSGSNTNRNIRITEAWIFWSKSCRKTTI